MKTSSPAILLVDDAVDERQIYAEFLQSSGCLTLQAGNALDGYRLAAELKPDVAVIDLVLPGMSGVELVRKLKTGDSVQKELPVIALTGRVRPSDEQAAKAAGCDRFLSKPCLPDDLLTEVRAVLPKTKRRQLRRHASLSGRRALDADDRPHRL